MVFCIVIYVIHLLTGMYERFSQDVLPIWCDNLIPDRLDMGTIHERLVRVRIYLESFRFLKYLRYTLNGDSQCITDQLDYM